MSYRPDTSYRRYANYRANKHQYKMNQIATPIAMMLIIGVVSKFWWILLGVGVVILASALCIGIGTFAYIMGPSYLTGALFGNKEFGTILGIVQIFFAAGFGIGSTLFGVVVDMAGYNAGWISTIVYAALAYGGLLTSTSAIIKHNKEINVTETKKIA